MFVRKTRFDELLTNGFKQELYQHLDRVNFDSDEIIEDVFEMCIYSLIGKLRMHWLIFFFRICDFVENIRKLEQLWGSDSDSCGEPIQTSLIELRVRGKK